MARTRRSFRGSMPRRRRPKGDWVYRGNAVRADGITDELSSYGNSVPLTAGPTTTDAVILYDSKQHLAMQTKQGMAGGGAGAPAYSLPTAARAEGGRPLILRVQGVSRLTPSTWAVGNNIIVGYRIMKVAQDAGSGSILLDNDYTMWPPAINATQVADHANARSLNLHEKRFFEVFNTSESASWTIRWNVKLRTRLAPNECLAVYIDSPTQSVNTNHYFWLRTFVVDEGTG